MERQPPVRSPNHSLCHCSGKEEKGTRTQEKTRTFRGALAPCYNLLTIDQHVSRSSQSAREVRSTGKDVEFTSVCIFYLTFHFTFHIVLDVFCVWCRYRALPGRCPSGVLGEEHRPFLARISKDLQPRFLLCLVLHGGRT